MSSLSGRSRLSRAVSATSWAAVGRAAMSRETAAFTSGRSWSGIPSRLISPLRMRKKMTSNEPAP